MLIPEKLLCDSETDAPASACNYHNFGGHDGNMVGFAIMLAGDAQKVMAVKT